MENSFYLNQSNARLELETKDGLTDVASAKIKYIKPDKTEGEWQAGITGTIVFYDFTKNIEGGSELDQLGEWIVWPFLIYNDGRTLPGDADILIVFKEGRIIRR
jgi:hypothetical protein